MFGWLKPKTPVTMRDVKVSGPRIAKLHPKIRNEVPLIMAEIEAGFPSTIAVRVVQGFRTYAEQDELYAQGRTKPGPIVTNAKGGFSNHNFAFAIDFAILYDKDGNGKYETLSWDTLKDFDRDGESDWKEVVKVFKKYGYEWGGDWSSIKDDPHVQKTFGLSVAQLRDKVAKHQVDAAGYVII